MFNRIRFHLFKWFRPAMVGRYRRADGSVAANTRVSNTTHIGNPEHLTIGDHVFIGHFNFLDASNGLTIGEGCQVTNYVSILTHSSHMSIRLYGRAYAGTDMKAYVRGSIAIGAFTFVGPHSVIMPGTKIGKGSIVGAYAYVSGEFPDFAIISGNPAKAIGDTRRMDERILRQHPELREHYNAWANS